VEAAPIQAASPGIQKRQGDIANISIDETRSNKSREFAIPGVARRCAGLGWARLGRVRSPTAYLAIRRSSQALATLGRAVQTGARLWLGRERGDYKEKTFIKLVTMCPRQNTTAKIAMHTSFFFHHVKRESIKLIGKVCRYEKHVLRGLINR